MSVLYLTIACCTPVLVQAEIDVKAQYILDLDKSPIDICTTPDSKFAYILTSGEVQVYSLITRTLLGRIPVDKAVGRISISSRGDQLYLLNERTKTLSTVSVAFVNMFNVAGSPFKGPANAPIVITVFSDYQ